MTINGYEISFIDDENGLKLSAVMVTQMCEHKTTGLYTLHGCIVWAVNYIFMILF